MRLRRPITCPVVSIVAPASTRGGTGKVPGTVPAHPTALPPHTFLPAPPPHLAATSPFPRAAWHPLRNTGQPLGPSRSLPQLRAHGRTFAGGGKGERDAVGWGARGNRLKPKPPWRR